MPLKLLPSLIVVLGVGGTVTALMISRNLGLVESCNVYLEGCISISAAGRQEVAVHVFRATIVPMAALTVPLWHLVWRWLGQLGTGGAWVRGMVWLAGVSSPPLLIVYVVLIGEPGDLIHEIRQTAVRIYFPVAVLTQVLTSLLAWQATGKSARPRWPAVLLLLASLAGLVTLLAVIPVARWLDDPSRVHNLMQWHATTAFIGWFAALQIAWLREERSHR